ncbi:c-type cytochrome [Azospira inquinata]|uniref:Cytochrome c5 family protein n=1 Tax=Azospira inquinata TaxID=2785627 RepID=A0A975SPH9_9RHOO|nr:c-type cytochrome [Azospira inquinata]QWT47203.1 cytochrome c5 family protein [Azospira inquinata]QWT50169.1 cytochrome c5 family protein [Azospira inquinata]
MSQQQDSSSSSILLWTIVGAVVLMLIAVPFAYLGKGNGSSNNDDAETRIAPVAQVEIQSGGADADSGKPKDGQTVVQTVCSACHGSGALGSPKIGDKAAWGPRIAQGKEALYHSALNGKNSMPARGGSATLTDDEVKGAVDYLISQAK